MCENSDDAGMPTLAKIDAGVGVALDAACVAHGGAAEEHRVEWRRAAKTDSLLQQFGHFLLHHLEEAAPACCDTRRVGQHLEVRTGDRHVFAWRSHARRGFVGRDDEHSTRPAEEHVVLTPAQTDRGRSQPARQQLRAVAVAFDHGDEVAAEAVHRLARREAREREGARVAAGGRVAERRENARKHGAVDVLGGEVPHGTARAEPVFDGIEARQRQTGYRHGVRRALPVERHGSRRAHREAVLALHAPVGEGHARRTVLQLERTKGAVTHARAAFDACSAINLKKTCHIHQ